MTARTPNRLPDWPRGLGADLAAAYLGVSVTTLRAGAKQGSMPAPTRITRGRDVWLRDVLDAWLDRQAGITRTTTPESDWDDI